MMDLREIINNLPSDNELGKLKKNDLDELKKTLSAILNKDGFNNVYVLKKRLKNKEITKKQYNSICRLINLFVKIDKKVNKPMNWYKINY